MSDMREEMLRTLDRIVEETLTPKAREAGETEIGASGAGAAPGGALGGPLWSALDGAGLLAVAGAGGDTDVSFADAMALVRRSAYHAIPVPLGEAIVGRWLARRAGLEAPDGAIGLSLASPESPIGLSGLASRQDGVSVTVARSGDGPVLIAGIGAGRQGQLALLDIGATSVTLSRNIAGEQRETFTVAPPHAGQKLLAVADHAGAGADLFLAGALLRVVQMAGALDRTLEHCMLWANDRVQFGRQIGKFQAIQHQLAVLASEAAAATAAVDQAIEASGDAPDFLAIAVAKARVGEAAGKGANIAHAVFGAMGFTREHALHFSTRRLWAWRNEFGGEAHWQGELGRLFAAKGGNRLWETLTARG